MEGIDLKQLQAEVAQLSDEEVRDQMLKLRTRQKKQQLKHSGSPSAIAYRKKRAEMNKLLAARAKEMGIYDEILEEAAKTAKAEAGAEINEVDDEETEAA